MTATDDVIWINGAILPTEEAKLSALDHGITVGDGLFETMKVVTDPEGLTQAFALRRHLERLRLGAARIGLVIPAEDEQLRVAIRAVLDHNATTSGRVRVTVTGGIGPLGSDRGRAQPSIIVATSPLSPWPPTTTLATVPWRRNEHSPVAGIKTTSYAENVVALLYAHDHDAGEAILANTAGDLCEGTGTNIFVGIDGRLITPPLSSGCLAGITRELLIEVLDVDEINLPIGRLADAQEVFVTSSTRDVHPVRAIDHIELPECPGPLTRGAMTSFLAVATQSFDP